VRKVKLEYFLTARKDRFRPNDEEIADLWRIQKIDFDGNIHLSKKVSRTQMIKVHSGDLVISGINVAKGALSIYRGKTPVKATIHIPLMSLMNH